MVGDVLVHEAETVAKEIGERAAAVELDVTKEADWGAAGLISREDHIAERGPGRTRLPRLKMLIELAGATGINSRNTTSSQGAYCQRAGRTLPISRAHPGQSLAPPISHPTSQR